MELLDANAIAALRKSRKAAIRYDRYFEEEGRTKTIIEEISSRLTRLSISPKALNLVKVHASPHVTTADTEKPSLASPTAPLNESKEHSADEIFCPDIPNEDELSILEYEDEWIRNTQELYNKKKKEYENFTLELQQQVELKYNMRKQSCELNALRDVELFQRSQEQLLKNLYESQRHIQRNGAQELSKRVQEIESQRLEEERNQAEKHLQATLMEHKNKVFSDLIVKVEQAFKSCNVTYLSTPSEAWMKGLDDFATSVDALLGTSCVTEEIVHKYQSSIRDLEEIYQSIIADVAQAQKKAQEELQIKEKETALGKLSRQVSETNLTVTDEPKKVDTSPSPAKVSPSKEKVPQKVEPNEDSEEMEESSSQTEVQPNRKSDVETVAATEYWTAVEHLKKFEASLEGFRTNPDLKKYRMLLHKAVAVNNLGDASSRQLKSKIVHLTNLLSGQTVECGGKYTSCKQHPDAANYCKNLLAEKIVTQGEEQVQSKIDFAFPFAFVAVALCSRFPDLWQLLLGHFYSRCPYLAPYCLKREEVDSDEEYMKCIGFKYLDGKIEELTTYLKRMHGYAVLYAAILQTTLPSNIAGARVINIQRGWMWLSCTLNTEPKPDITATLMLAVLEVLGHTMEKIYDRQFKKMLHVLCKDYFPKIKNLAGSTAGPVGRLKTFLQSAITKGHIPQPSGASKIFL